MKKIISTLLAGIMTIGGMLALSGCNGDKSGNNVFKKEITYKVVTEDFFFSTDNGATYGNRRVEFEVGKSVYMQVVICIESSDSKPHEIQGEFIMPYVDSLNARYLKGQEITPSTDYANKITKYPFVITTNEDWTFFFELTPNSAGTLDMKLTFDDQIDEKYDMTNTIKMVESADPTGVIESEETIATTTETTVESTSESTSETTSESTVETKPEVTTESTPGEVSESTSETTKN